MNQLIKPRCVLSSSTSSGAWASSCTIVLFDQNTPGGLLSAATLDSRNLKSAGWWCNSERKHLCLRLYLIGMGGVRCFEILGMGGLWPGETRNMIRCISCLNSKLTSVQALSLSAGTRYLLYSHGLGLMICNNLAIRGTIHSFSVKILHSFTVDDCCVCTWHTLTCIASNKAG